MPQPWAAHPHRLYGSGRDAVRALVVWGVEHRGWRRVLVPSYYCQDVVVPIQGVVTVAAYPHAPTEPAGRIPGRRTDELVLTASLFGLHPGPPTPSPSTTLEDHTHDPLARAAWESSAGYAFASLRKTLPLPDGGVLWSPQGLDLPPPMPVTADHERATYYRLAAMVLKRHYLSGDDVSKKQFRDLAIEGERAFGHGTVSGMSAFSAARLPTLPAASWRERRQENRRVFRAAIGEVSDVEILDAPFAVSMVFPTRERRDRVRDQLARARVYGTVYWPLDAASIEGIPAPHVALSHRILTLHCDQRYTPEDMRRVAVLCRSALGGM